MSQTAIRRFLKHGTLPQLSVFEAVARLGSFTRAAEELHMAQPTVSVQMKKITESAGLPLIKQSRKQIQLTEAGRVLYDACLEIFSTLDNAERALACIRDPDAKPPELAAGTDGKYFTPFVGTGFAPKKLEVIAAKIVK